MDSPSGDKERQLGMDISREHESEEKSDTAMQNAVHLPVPWVSTWVPDFGQSLGSQLYPATEMDAERVDESFKNCRPFHIESY